MNSTLQGLLTLTPFVQEVHNQERVWSSHPKCELIRYSHTHSDHSLVSLLPLQVNMKKHIVNISLSLVFLPSSFALSRGFVEVGVCRFSRNAAEKEMVLADFKDTVAELNSEFEDDSQKVSSLFYLLHTAEQNIDID